MAATYELWFRRAYQEGLAKRQFHAAVRPGDRRAPMPKGTRVGEVARVRTILVPGSDDQKTQPVFNGFTSYVRVTALVVKAIGELTPADLRSCSADTQSAADVKTHLGAIYERDFSDRELVTVVHWVYIEGTEHE